MPLAFAAFALLAASPLGGELRLPADAARNEWIGICPESVAAGPVVWRGPVRLASGERAQLVVARTAVRGCRGVRIALGGRRIRWAGLPTGSFAEGADLIGRVRDTRFDAEEIVSLPIATDAAADVPTESRGMWRAFGAEGRAAVVQSAGEATLTCREGTRPAGAIFRPADWRRAGREVRVEYQTSAGLNVLVADSVMHASERSVPLGVLDPARRVSWHTVPAGVAANASAVTFTFVCPASAATLRVVRVVRTEDARPAVRAAWFWSPSVWRDHPERIFDIQSRLALRTVYIGGALTPGDAYGARILAAFVRAANAHDLAVWPVLGDPRHATTAGRERLVREIGAFAAYQRDASPEESLAGLQLDIEPYILPEFAAGPRAWLGEYRATIDAAHRAWGRPLNLVMPFWWSGGAIWPSLRAFLDTMPDASVTVMDYRTAPWELRHRVEPFLRWGNETRHTVQVAVELGEVPDNTQLRFIPAAAGELWEVKVGGTRALLLLDRAGAPKAGRAFRLAFSRIVSGGDVSFRGDWQGMFDASRVLNADFGQWPSFAGLAVHGVDDRSVALPPWCADCAPRGSAAPPA